MRDDFLGCSGGHKFWTETQSWASESLDLPFGSVFMSTKLRNLLQTVVFAEWDTLPPLPCVLCGVLTLTVSEDTRGLHQDLKEHSKLGGMTKYCPRHCSSYSNLVIVAVGNEHSLYLMFCWQS